MKILQRIAAAIFAAVILLSGMPLQSVISDSAVYAAEVLPSDAFDGWGFPEKQEYFSRYDDGRWKYILRDYDRERLFSELNFTEQERIQDVLRGNWRGSSYGMASLAMLTNAGYVTPDQFFSGADSLSAITAEAVQENEDFCSFVNFYEMLRYTDDIVQHQEMMSKQPDSSILDSLIETLCCGIPVMLGYTFRRDDDTVQTDFVIASAVRKREGEIPRLHDSVPFDAEILLYHPRIGKQSEFYNMYVNTQYGHWAIPMSENPDDIPQTVVSDQESNGSGKITLLISDPEVLNQKGQIDDAEPLFGKCGKNVTWRYDEKHQELYIYGSGEMEEHPQMRKEARYVRIEDGVRNISAFAFNCYAELMEIEIPDSVTEIGERAFNGCTELSSIVIPDSVTVVGHECFGGCRKLETVKLPQDLRVIETYLFSDCTSLKSVVMPNQAMSIGYYAFSGCVSLEAVTIPDGTADIGQGAFMACQSLSSVTLPESVSRVDSSAFTNCINLEELVFLNPNCLIDRSEWTIPENTLIRGYADSTAQWYAFMNCRAFSALDEEAAAKQREKLKSGSFGSNMQWSFNESNGWLTISGSGDMPDYISPADAPWVGLRDAVKSVEIKNGITGIGNCAFAGYRGLVGLYFPESLTRIGQRAFFGCGMATLRLSEGFVSIEDDSFGKNSRMKNVTLPSTMKLIGYRSFSDCDALEDITVWSKSCLIQDGAIPPQAKICGYTGSTADEYAQQHKNIFVPLDLRGDANCDGVVDENDAALIQKEYANLSTGSESLLTEQGRANADVNGNGSIDAADASAVLYYVAHGWFPDAEQNVTTEPVTDTTISTTTTTVTTTTPKPTTSTTTSTVTTTTPKPTTSTTTVTTTTPKPTTSTTTVTTTTPKPTTSTTTVTTTTPKPTTSTTTSTVTTTTDTGTTTTVTTTVPFVFGRDNWGFPNVRQYLSEYDASNRMNHYAIGTECREALMQKLSPPERMKVQEILNGKWGGSCYGMSVMSILAGCGIVSAETLVGDRHSLYDIESADINDTVRSSVNYYQMLQYTQAVSQHRCRMERLDDRAKLKMLMDALSDGKPVLLGYTFNMRNDRSKNGHAVVAYGIRSISGIKYVGGKLPFSYDKEILIYNNLWNKKNPSKLQLYHMFINTEKSLWLIPMEEDNDGYITDDAIMNLSDHRCGVITMIESDLSLMNAGGLYGDMPIIPYDEQQPYYASMQITSLKGFDISASKDPYDGSFYAGEDNGSILFTSNFMDANENDRTVMASMEGDCSYEINCDTAQQMDVSMEYRHCLLQMASAQTVRVTVSPEARIKCDESKGRYDFMIVHDNGCSPTDWHTLRVSGRDAGTVLLSADRSQKGWVLSADSLKNVSVSAENDTDKAEIIFTAECRRVLIYEIDRHTIGIKADTDGDGTYETEIKEKEILRGDADMDGAVTVNDAQMVLIAYTELMTAGTHTLDSIQEQAADADKDGEITVLDAQYILNYFVQNSLAGNAAGWDEIVGIQRDAQRTPNRHPRERQSGIPKGQDPLAESRGRASGRRPQTTESPPFKHGKKGAWGKYPRATGLLSPL